MLLFFVLQKRVKCKLQDLVHLVAMLEQVELYLFSLTWRAYIHVR